ncbi:hypothetical protein L3556_00140 [Candidatus Synechococcus calcipolaris G9]|uniref:Uncharacterized protein n=1 Tax=Candidatus Synechococcus calcipolaris G9 TaxID=1497997 RepID=A0ABT6EWR2_9SYNE|nr:hypothetical protein [Candidatus Synechococcus calcipolaris]MDG2989345.1 hypothetical protein [Candidatus Synechococcus calcipolaris G9]
MSEVEKRRLQFNDQQWRAIANPRQTIEEALASRRLPSTEKLSLGQDLQTQQQQEIRDLKETVRQLQSQLSEQQQNQQKSHQKTLVAAAATQLSASHLLDLHPSLAIQPLGIRPWQADVQKDVHKQKDPKSLPDRPLKAGSTPGTMATPCGSNTLSRAQVDLPRFARR